MYIPDAMLSHGSHGHIPFHSITSLIHASRMIRGYSIHSNTRNHARCFSISAFAAQNANPRMKPLYMSMANVVAANNTRNVVQLTTTEAEPAVSPVAV